MEARRGPFRVHRMPLWNPLRWFNDSARNPTRDYVGLRDARPSSRNTGSPRGSSTAYLGCGPELFDYEWFFAGFASWVREPVARALRVNAGQKVVYFPPRGFQLVEYALFMLPMHPGNWMEEFRGYAAFLDDTELVYPSIDLFDDPGKEAAQGMGRDA